MISINLKNFSISNNSPFVLIAGPCVIENEIHSLMIAEQLHKICDDVGINLIFKSSFDKANRSSINSDSCLLYTSPSPRDRTRSRMPSSA